MKEIKNTVLSTDKENPNEKALKQSIVISALGIVFCMISLCSVTWAWFNINVSSSANSIRSSYYDLSVLVTNENAVVDAVDGKYVFLKDKEYQIKITANGTAETAYCALNINGNEYYTDKIPTRSIVIDDLPVENNITFTLRFTDNDTEVEFIPCWGAVNKANTEIRFKNGIYYIDMVESEPPISVPSENNSGNETAPPETNTEAETATLTTHVTTVHDSIE